MKLPTNRLGIPKKLPITGTVQPEVKWSTREATTLCCLKAQTLESGCLDLSPGSVT